MNLTLTTFPVGATATIVLNANVVAGSGSAKIINRVDALPPGGNSDNYSGSDYAIYTNDVATLRTITLKKEAATGGTILSVPS